MKIDSKLMNLNSLNIVLQKQPLNASHQLHFAIVCFAGSIFLSTQIIPWSWIWQTVHLFSIDFINLCMNKNYQHHNIKAPNNAPDDFVTGAFQYTTHFIVVHRSQSFSIITHNKVVQYHLNQKFVLIQNDCYHHRYTIDFP